jgi:hypothetical protein
MAFTIFGHLGRLQRPDLNGHILSFWVKPDKYPTKQPHPNEQTCPGQRICDPNLGPVHIDPDRSERPFCPSMVSCGPGVSHRSQQWSLLAPRFTLISITRPPLN